MHEVKLELRQIRLSLLELLDGVKGSFLWQYNNELEALLDLPSQEREKKLEELAKKINKEYKEQVGK